MSTFNYLDAISIYLRLVSPKMKVKIRNLENIWRYRSILHNHSPELPFRKHRSLHSNWKPESVYHSSSSTRQHSASSNHLLQKGCLILPLPGKAALPPRSPAYFLEFWAPTFHQITGQMLEQMPLPQGMLWWLGPIPSLCALFLYSYPLQRWDSFELYIYLCHYLPNV